MSGCEIINDVKSEPIQIKLPKSLNRNIFGSYNSQIDLDVNHIVSASPTYSLAKNTPPSNDPIKLLLKKINQNKNKSIIF